MKMNLRRAWNFRLPPARKRQPVFAFIFIFALCLPVLKSIVSPAEMYTLRDHRGMKVSTALVDSRLPGPFRDWNAYANERFGGRDLLIHWNNLFQVKLLKVSPLETLMLGRNGWLFLDGPNLEMNYFRSDKPFSENELALWRRVLLQRHIWLERQGIRFLYVIAPNKSSIYPEKVPARIHRAATRLDQLLDYLQQQPLPSGFRLVDLRKTMQAARSRYPVYGRIDSHWNSFGALLAADKMIRVLSRSNPLQPPGLEDFTISLEAGAGPRGDLAAMLSLSDVLYDPQSVKVTPRFSSRVIVTEPARWIDENLQREVTICPGAEFPEALMFRDSFGYALAGFLSEHFQKITYVRDIGLGFDPDIVLNVRPKIVIQEMAERFFQVLAPFNSAELAAIDVDPGTKAREYAVPRLDF
jgi:alginate O-acetyltransferase complex protein AlgJ